MLHPLITGVIICFNTHISDQILNCVGYIYFIIYSGDCAVGLGNMVKMKITILYYNVLY